MKAPTFTCPFCDRKAKEGFTLKDQDGLKVGVYCTKDCAEQDAWGPRFAKRFSIRKASSADIAACAS